MNTDLTKIYEQYQESWVALTEKLDKVISANKDIRVVYKEATEKGYKKPTLFKVPQKNIAYFGIINTHEYPQA